MLVDIFGTYAASESTCRYQFSRFKNGDFKDEDHRERSGRSKLFEGEKLEALVDQNLDLKLSRACQNISY